MFGHFSKFLGPLASYYKIGYMVPAYTPRDHSTKVSSSSNNLQGYFGLNNCEPRITLYARQLYIFNCR